MTTLKCETSSVVDKVLWRKNGKDIPDIQRYTISHNEKDCQLKIEDTGVEDEGDFTCAIQGTKEETTCHIRVQGNI